MPSYITGHLSVQCRENIYAVIATSIAQFVRVETSVQIKARWLGLPAVTGNNLPDRQPKDIRRSGLYTGPTCGTRAFVYSTILVKNDSLAQNFPSSAISVAVDRCLLQITMSTRMTRISRLMADRKLNDAYAVIENYERIVSANVTAASAAERMLLGTVLHVAKAKKFSFTSAGRAEKKIRREGVYHRILFCR